MRFGPLVPNICPSCNTGPYPHGRPCESCGFQGVPDDPRRRLHRRIALAGLLVILTMLLAILLSFISIF